MPRILVFASLALVFVCSPAMAANYPWEGRWAPIGEVCGESRVTLTYTKRSTEGAEDFCNITSIKSYNLKHSWYPNLECSGEGYEWKKAEILIFHENKLISYQEMTSEIAGSSNLDSLQTLQRCN